MVEQQNGNTVLVAVGLDQNMYVNWQMSNGSWAGWGSLGSTGGGFTTAPAALVQPSGNTVVIAIGADGNLYLNWQNASTEAWSGWSNLGQAGGGFTTPAIIEQHNGNTVLVDIGADKNVYFGWQNASTEAWSGWGGLGDAGGGFVSLVSVSGQVTTGGSGFSGVTVRLAGNTAAGTGVSQTTTTGFHGNYAFSVLIGSYTLTPSRSGYTFSPASQIFNNVGANQTAQTTRAAGGSSTPPSCLDISPGYLGTSQLSGAGTFTATATVATSVTTVTFQIYNEQSQSLSTASPYQGNLSSSSSVLGYNQYTVTLPSSSFQALGSYAVTAQVQDSGGHKASCALSASAFFAIVNDSAELPALNGQTTTRCGGSGTWNESPASGSSVWNLSQSGTSVSGTLTVTNPGCTSLKWTVAGSSNNGVLNLTASNPSPSQDSCGNIAATTVTANNITVSGAGCDSASGTDTDTFPPGYGTQTFSVNWAASASVPSGETSIFDQWGPDGYSNQGLFRGRLTTSSGAAEFVGRRVQESFPVDVVDGCAQADPSHLLPPLHASGAGSSWNVLSDSSYTDDWIGYGPASTRYFQMYVGSCSLKAPQQQMSISADNNQWLPYKSNALEYDVTSTSVTAKRDTASQTSTYPK